MVLKKQSEGKWLVRHFLKGYLYDDDEGEEGGGGAVRDAWDNWKAIYNMSLGMTYGMSDSCYFCLLLAGRTKDLLLPKSQRRASRQAGLLLILEVSCLHSFFRGTSLEMLYYSCGLDSRNYHRSAYTRCCKLVIL